MNKKVVQPMLALLLLLLPALVAVSLANGFANLVYPSLVGLIEPLQSGLANMPAFVYALLVDDYGLVSMFPFLLLYALPTVFIFSLLLEIYQSSGLIARLSSALHAWLKPFGIGARDLVSVVMGFGCNVAAVVDSRSCDACSRGACISAISFGSACSYQLPATLAVFAVAGMAYLGVVYVVVLAVTTLIYLRFTRPKVLRMVSQQSVHPELRPLRAPSLRVVLGKALGSVREFLVMSTPTFAIICFVAASLEYFGALDALSHLLEPVMALFRLPGEAATSIALGSIRKDGIAIGLLDQDWGALKVSLTTPAQVLTVVYLAGVLLPCLVTLYTIGREMNWKFALRLCVRQMAWACGFALVIAWLGLLF